MPVGVKLTSTCVCEHQNARDGCRVGLEPLAQQRLAVIGHHQRLRSCVLVLGEGLHRQRRRCYTQAGVNWRLLPCSSIADRQLGSLMHL